MLHFLSQDYSSWVSFPMELMFIQDENAFFHSLINLLPTFYSDFYADSRLQVI